jgi:hypothetical protein
VRSPPRLSSFGPTKFVRSMADYHSIIAKAVSSLDPNTGEARRRLYGRSRTALLAEIRRAHPPLDHSEILVARKSLEEAIGKVETQALREPSAHQEPKDAFSPSSSHQHHHERIAARPTFGTTMADYYSLVARATSALGAHTEEARRRVYDHARAAFISEVHKTAPALDRSQIMTEQFYLELAIGEVEAEQRERSARSTVGQPATGSVVAAPSAQANQNDEEVRDLRSGKLAAARYPEQYGQPIDEGDCQRIPDTRLTDLLARASHGSNNDQTDFTPKRALRHTAQ